MRKEIKILSFSNAKIEKLNKVDQAKLKGGAYAMGLKEGCPPPVGGFKEEDIK